MFSDPETIVPYFGLTDGNVIADFGVGSGHYALALAKRLGLQGKVYAIDVQKNLLDRLAAEAKRQGCRNLEIVWGDVEKSGGSKLADQTVDLVLVANLFFQTEARYSVALEAKRILRPGGKVALVDWSNSFNNLGPLASQVVPAEEAKKIMVQAGFNFLNDFPAGAHHYGLLFQK